MWRTQLDETDRSITKVRFIAAIALTACAYVRPPTTTAMVEVTPEEQRPAPPRPPSTRRVLLVPGLVVLGVGAALIAAGVPVLLDEQRASAEARTQDAAFCMTHPCDFSLNIDLSTMGGTMLLAFGTIASVVGLIFTIVGATGHK
jgi:hypothetical protein